MFLEHEYCVYLCSPDKTKQKTNKKHQTNKKNPTALEEVDWKVTECPKVEELQYK